MNMLLDTVIELATIWATMSTIDGIPSILEAPTTDFERNREYLVEWAEEYNSLKDMDKYEFIKEKLRKV
ncbi:MAG: hypothetical protein J6L69_10085 [Lachnospiraceae bacterium]|nr:hypothetical protein [Lachnospiraceae bacterium]